MAVLELRGIQAGRRGKDTLQDLSLSVEAGEAFLVLGKQGAGKTCLLSIASGQALPRSGTVRLYGSEYPRHSRRVGAVVSNPSLFENLCVADNLMARALSLGVAQARQAVDATMARLRLADHAGEKAGTLPAGPHAWLQLAWALIGSPDLLILDDILRGLDPQDRTAMAGMLRRLVSEEGVTLLMASREAASLMSVATRIGILADGRIDRAYTPEELRGALKRRVRVRTSSIETTLARIETELADAQIVLTENGSLEIAGNSLDEVSRLLDRLPERVIELTETSVPMDDALREAAPRC